jgi:hypothetical protein
MEHYATVYRFSSSHEAELARTILLNQGITARLRDEHTLTMLNGYENALGGLQLEVAESDLENARIVLQLGQLIPVEPELNPDIMERLGSYLGNFPVLSALSPIVRILCVIALLTLILLLPLAI